MGDLEIFEDFEKFMDDDFESGIEKKNAFEVKDLSAANWCAGKIKTATVKIEEAKKFRDAVIEKAKRWFEAYTKEYNQTIDRLSEYLKPYVEKEIADKKTKSIKLMGITAGFRKGQLSIDIVDETKAIESAKAQGVPVKVKEYLDKRTIKEALKEGKGFEGIEIHQPTEHFYVKVDTDED